MQNKSYGKDIKRVANDLRALRRDQDIHRGEFLRFKYAKEKSDLEWNQKMNMLRDIVYGHAKQRVPPAHTPEL